MIRKFVGGGFKIPCFYCKIFNIVYPQDSDYMHASLEPCLHKDSVLSMALISDCVGRQLGITGLYQVYNYYKEGFFPKLLEDNTVSDEEMIDDYRDITNTIS